MTPPQADDRAAAPMIGGPVVGGLARIRARADGLNLRDLILHWLLPVILGALIVAGLTIDLLWARGVSLMWAAPFLRDEAPPLLTLVAALLLG